MLRLVTLKREAIEANRVFNQAIDSLANSRRYVEDLWAEIGPNFPEGIERLATATGVGRATLIEILADASKELEPLPTGWWSRLTAWVARRRFVAAAAGWWNRPRPWAGWWYRSSFARHGPEFVGLAIVLALLSLLFANALRGRNTVTVAREGGLSAFRVISREDITVQPAIYVPGALSSEEEVVGRYLLQQAPRGSRLYSSQLSRVKLSEPDARGRQVLSLPLKAGQVNARLSPLDRVSLLFSPRKTDEKRAEGWGEEEPLRVDDVIVLAVNREGADASVVVALRADMQKVAAALGNSDLTIFQPMTREPPPPQ